MQATADSFARSGYFGGPRTVPWNDELGALAPYGLNQSGSNLLLNLQREKIQTAKMKETEIDQVSSFRKMPDEPGSHC